MVKNIFNPKNIWCVCNVKLVWLLVDVTIGQLWSDCWAGGVWWCSGRGRAQQQPTGRWSQAGPATTHQDTGGMEAGARARDTHAITIHIPSHGDPHTTAKLETKLGVSQILRRSLLGPSPS